MQLRLQCCLFYNNTVIPVARSTSGFISAVATETVPCPVCGGTRFGQQFVAGDYEYKLPGEFVVAQCFHCGLLLQNPRPPFSEIGRYYPAEYEPLVSEQTIDWVTRFKLAVLLGPRLRLYRALIGPAGRIVDIGCGAGRLLNALCREGDWELHGIEPSPFCPSSNNRVHIHSGTLESAGFASDSFNLAIMNHVLEHVPEPGSTVREVLRILKPGAYFCGEVPNPQCLERFLFGKYWGGYHLPRHLTFFSPTTLQCFLQNAGFVDVSLKMNMQPSSWLVSVSNLLTARQAPPAVSGLFSDRNVFWLSVTTPLAWLIAKFGFAPSVRFVCRKPV